MQEPGPGDEILRIDGMNAGYGPHQVIFDVTAGFRQASVSAIVGPNGAGKSTILKAMFGLARRFSGDVYLRGRRLTGNVPELVAEGLAYVPQAGGVFASMSVQDNLRVGGFVRDRVPVDEIVELFPELSALMRRPAGRLSGGQQRMVAIARALRAGPDALFLDESTSGLSPMACDHLWERIKVLSSRGVAVVVVEQNVDLALEHSDNMLVLVSGRVAVHEDVAALTADTLADAFLGSNAH